jgi:DeoR family transcriptional regulator of aga operon
MDNQSEQISTANRRAKIVEELDAKGIVQVPELSKQYNVSLVTIRNDLANLEEKKLLIRTRGGAIKQPKVVMDLTISEKSRQNYEQKKRIGKKAAELINEGDIIILDSGTTTMEVAKHIKEPLNLTVITHALNIALELASRENIEIIMPGGTLYSKSYSLVGSITEQNLKEFYSDILFLSVDGFDLSAGIYTPNVAEAQINRVMAEITREVVIVTDSSKFGKRSLALILPIFKINTVITDDGITDEDREKLLSHNIKLIIA